MTTTNEVAKLEACPCKSVVELRFDRIEVGNWIQVVCDACGRRGAHGGSQWMAAKLWNNDRAAVATPPVDAEGRLLFASDVCRNQQHRINDLERRANSYLLYVDHLRGCTSYTNGACTCGLENTVREPPIPDAATPSLPSVAPARCANCAELITRTNTGWVHEFAYRPECLNVVPAPLPSAVAPTGDALAPHDHLFIRLLLDWRKWYSEDLFSPWTIKEAQMVHTEFPGAVDRISADSARGTIDHIIADIRAGKHRTWEDNTLNGNEATFAATPVAVPENEQDHERLNELLDALPGYPTEEQAEEVLRAAGTSGKEVANQFIERLLRENLELKTKLAATTQSSDQVARAAAEEIREWTGISGLVDGEGVNEVAAIISRHLRAAAVPVEPQVEVNES